MKQRDQMVAWIRGELVGPGQPLGPARKVTFKEGTTDFDERAPEPTKDESEPRAIAPLYWLPKTDEGTAAPQEILYFQNERPQSKYGAGLLHPRGPTESSTQEILQSYATAAADASEKTSEEFAEENAAPEPTDKKHKSEEGTDGEPLDITSPDVRDPSSMAISVLVEAGPNDEVRIEIPSRNKFAWQPEEDAPFPVNGWYQPCKRHYEQPDNAGGSTQRKEGRAWRRQNATCDKSTVTIRVADFKDRKPIPKPVTLNADTGSASMELFVTVYPRIYEANPGHWLLTVVLENRSNPSPENILYQSFFSVSVSGADSCILPYPESKRKFEDLDEDEQSLQLLYRDAKTWAVGHGSAAGWQESDDGAPRAVFADSMPAVELPSMTPDAEGADGQPISLSMHHFSELGEYKPDSPAWKSLETLQGSYRSWIVGQKEKCQDLAADEANLAAVGERHLKICTSIAERIARGIVLLKEDKKVRRAFELTNNAMMWQQTASKNIKPRNLEVRGERVYAIKCAAGKPRTPTDDIRANADKKWRAFQLAFLLMSLEGMSNENSEERLEVDLVWFPTGGGKTEAYLGVMAFYMFHQRLLIEGDQPSAPNRDGTNAIMRYTLRMLTTQQFQRAASLICAMEILRRKQEDGIKGGRFSLGLWVGSSASPNKNQDAFERLAEFKNGRRPGNPLILVDCPWCRARIGRGDDSLRQKIPQNQWKRICLAGIDEQGQANGEGPLLKCSDSECEFSGENPLNWLPVEVIDQRIYKNPPSLIVATADKLAMLAYRPEAGALFGLDRQADPNDPKQTRRPPGLIIQDELHLISGPLGTVYSIYETIIEQLCQGLTDEGPRPKIIASTATIRGANEQVKALYARDKLTLFPPPGLSMSDSFFGKYHQDNSGKLSPGRLYLGVHLPGMGSMQTAQVRTFSAMLAKPATFADSAKKDPWWTLLAFYNSIRELSGARTLVDSDIASRLNYLGTREGLLPADRRNRPSVEELTSRLAQSEIVGMIDRLSQELETPPAPGGIDVCLASNIIEVGVDIDRLSLMAVVGQPKSTAQYIQVTGRVGRRWWERPGLILTMLNPSKSRDRSHFEQFHSYHRRLYERVEPTSATPFAVSALQRALPGAIFSWVRLNNLKTHPTQIERPDRKGMIDEAMNLLLARCSKVQETDNDERDRASAAIDEMCKEILQKWEYEPPDFENFPQNPEDHYLMLWPGQFATPQQRNESVLVPSSMRQVDANAEFRITTAYRRTDTGEE